MKPLIGTIALSLAIIIGLLAVIAGAKERIEVQAKTIEEYKDGVNQLMWKYSISARDNVTIQELLTKKLNVIDEKLDDLIKYKKDLTKMKEENDKRLKELNDINARNLDRIHYLSDLCHAMLSNKDTEKETDK